jgi:2-polyprenyl-3-methyl-5-hydroxy-6-metoxy-1,4-benzoquinol methylase
MKNEIVCPLCGEKNYTVYLSGPNHRIVRCINDGLKYVNPQPDESEITRIYNENYFASHKKRSKTSDGYFDYMSEKHLLLPYFRRKIALLKTMLHGKKVLEIGSSYGFFLEEAKRASLDILGIDISRSAVAYAKSQGLPIRATDLIHARFPSNSFDGVVAFHLIEHVSNPFAHMREMYRITKPGGIIFLATPQEGGYLQRLTGRHWFNYRHQGHLFFFSCKTITALLKKAGYTRARCLDDETRWYPIHFLLRGAAYYVSNPWMHTACRWAEKVFHLFPFSYLQIPFPLDTMIITAEK